MFASCIERAVPGTSGFLFFRGWHADIQTVIDAVDKDQCYQWTLNNRLPVPGWSSARATLLGDAAHATLPYMAQGAAMAIEDAAVLARCFQTSHGVADALRLYQGNRIERIGRVVLESTQMRKLYRIESDSEMRDAFRQTNLARSRGEWLYSYDPTSAPLVPQP